MLFGQRADYRWQGRVTVFEGQLVWDYSAVCPSGRAELDMAGRPYLKRRDIQGERRVAQIVEL